MAPKKDKSSSLENLKADYCDKYLDTLPKRTDFVTTIRAKLQESPNEYDASCTTFLRSTSGLNTWFDPIDPMVSISEQEICDIHKKLFSSLTLKGITSLAEFVSFSYLITLDLYLNAN